MLVDVVPFGSVSAAPKREVSSGLRSAFDVDVTIQSQQPIPDTAYNSHRDQYDSEELAAEAARRGTGDLNLGLTENDLYDPNDASVLDVLRGKDDVDCVFGVAFLDGNGGVCSTYRLRPVGDERTNSTEGRLSDRIRKEAVKQVGHMLGLGYCENPRCVMHHASTVWDLDDQEEQLCGSCSRTVSVPNDGDTTDSASTDTSGPDDHSTDTKIFDPDDGGDTVVYDEPDAPTACSSCGHGLAGYDATAYCPSCGEPL